MQSERWPWSWIARIPPVGLDLAAVTGLLFLGIGGLLERPPSEGRITALAVLLIALQTVPLLFRRRWPLAVLVCVVGAIIARGWLGPPNLAGLGILLAVYSVAVYGQPVARVVVGAVGILALVVAVGAYLATGSNVIYLLIPGIAFSVAWLLGDYIRTRRAYLAELEERAQRAERDREDDARHAADAERARIARELHDVVAHHVSVIAVQAGAARMVHDTDPGAAARTLATIESTARQALVELSRLVGVMRRDDGASSPREPQPGLEYVDALIERAREAGLDVQLAVHGRTQPLPAAMDLSAYRIVQEALTNALKHAPHAHVEVAILYGSDELQVRVTDDGRGGRPDTGARQTGHGIIGMRERAALFGGDVEAGPRPNGGFRVAARLPLATAES